VSSPHTVLVTLASPARQVDAVADADVPIGRLLAPIADILGLGPQSRRVTVARAGDLSDTRAATLDQTLAEAGVTDGAVVIVSEGSDS
jgi:hypothetical protein